MTLIIEEKQIKNWLNQIRKKLRVFDLRKSFLPVKQYFLPSQEDIFEYDKIKGKLTIPQKPEKFVVFGLDLADLEAITQLDEIMKKPKPDHFYFQKRNQAVLIGLVDEFFETAPGGDIILQKINGQQYQILQVTKKGDSLLKSPIFKKSPQKTPQISKKPNNLKKMLLDSELLAEAVAWSWESKHKIWDELAGKCLGCGICTYLCPLCYCFSIEDRVDLEGRKCFRCRYWTSCTLPDFAEITGGHNFHQTIKERYYNWFFHKFVRAYKEYGKAQCTGCGRCQKFCPAGIDIEQVLKRIVGDFRDRQGG